MKSELVNKQKENTTKDITRWITLGALFLIPFAPLVVADSYFFPFITGKAFYLRILIEIAVAGWIVLAFLDREYRPRFSWIGVAFVVFVAWMFIADIFALNITKAFWSNFERMEGWIMLIHLLGFFFASSSVLRAENKWRAWFFVSIGVSIVVSVYALLQLGGVFAIHQGSTRIDASLGNSAYLAIYLLFSVFVALCLAFNEDRSWAKWSLILLAVFESVLIFFTETRGTIIGLFASFSLMALLTAVTVGKNIRRYAIGSLVLIAIAISGFYLARNSSFVQGNHTLQRIASISINDGQTRFTIWNMAFHGILDRPLTGYGQEGFNYIFNKYYDPSLHNQEPWFDRAHNAFIDWLAAGGIPAFLLYISFFVYALILLWKKSPFSRSEQIALTAVLAGYAIHNIFVFDNLYSYIYFFAILALIDSHTSKPIQRFENAHVLNNEYGMTYVLPIATAVTVSIIWLVNVPGMRTASKLIVAMTPTSSGISANIATFEDLAANPSFAAQEVREQTISFASQVVQSSSATDSEKQKIAELAITEMRKQVSSYPIDARARLQLAYAYRIAGDNINALNEITVAAYLSPKKEGILIEKGVTEWEIGNIKEAQADFNKAYELGPQFSELALYAAAGNIVVGEQQKANEILLKVYGTTEVDSDILAVAYYRIKDWPRLIAIWKLRTEKPNASVETWFGLASVYYSIGDNANAINIINKAVELYPSAASAGEAAIKQINSGQ